MISEASRRRPMGSAWRQGASPRPWPWRPGRPTAIGFDVIRHTVLLSFKGVDDAIVDNAISELRGLPALIPEIQSYTVDRDLGLVEGNATIVITADFASADDYETYSGHPEHVRVVTDSIKPSATGLALWY